MKATSLVVLHRKSGLFFSLILFMAFFISSTSCSDKKSEGKIEAPAGMVTLDLSRYGKPFMIFVPDTVSGRLSITEQMAGSLHIRVGDRFGISISEQFADLNLLKEDLKADEVNKLKKIHSEELQGIIWESEVVQPEFHFMMNRKIGENEYSFEDIRDSQANPYNKEAIERMYETARSAEPVNKQTNS